jgi:hypothetical protein
MNIGAQLYENMLLMSIVSDGAAQDAEASHNVVKPGEQGEKGGEINQIDLNE